MGYGMGGTHYHGISLCLGYVFSCFWETLGDDPLDMAM